ncbi:uncharacterized protein LOC123273084 isoform X2 [Cotesia glomerata]|uniref:uncharacterized protein LOC123273084 isoform X2 n=1 Tax=Cotesia glomerata TaxID=32391 RepID=UPI001D00D4F6|nr:uncharacterized protein LOC123273084 isoform X2 [Cotesia glomerata]
MSKRIRSVNCCNPFNESHKKGVKDLRKFPDEDRWKFPDLDDTSMLCVRCRFRVKEYIPPASEEEEIISSQISVESLNISAEICTQGSSLSRTVSNFSDNLRDYNDHSLERFLKIPLIEKDRLYSEKNYGVKKLDKSYAALENKFQSQFGIVPESTYRKINQDHCSMIAKVKKLYNAKSVIFQFRVLCYCSFFHINTIDRLLYRSIKKKLLSILPDSWEVSRIASEFNCSRKMFQAISCLS